MPSQGQGQLNVSINAELKQQFRKVAKENRTSATSLIHQWVQDYVDSKGKATNLTEPRSNLGNELEGSKKNNIETRLERLESALAEQGKQIEALKTNLTLPNPNLDREPEPSSSNGGNDESAPITTAQQAVTDSYGQDTENEQQKEVQPEPENNAATSQTSPTEWMSIDDTVSFLQSFGVDINKKKLSDRASKAFKEKPSKEGEFTFRGLVMERRKAGQSYEYKIVNGK